MAIMHKLSNEQTKIQKLEKLMEIELIIKSPYMSSVESNTMAVALASVVQLVGCHAVHQNVDVGFLVSVCASVWVNLK